ncbi:MAG: hypothetical protein HOH74_21095, partial [Gemmatimonadetes bacterium]|nr:hypothetical protein [Gemmatimonadota bacterium]
MPTTESSPTEAADNSGRRRRRRQADGVSVPVPAAESASPPASHRRRRTSHLRALAPKTWGLSPTFRVFLFLGGIIGVMAFLLYNEYIIQQFRDQERDRAELYAKLYGLAISEALPSDVSGDIFQTVILNPRVSFPLVVTDHRGRVYNWKGPGLPDPADTSSAALAAVQEAIADMDAVNEPLPASWNAEARVSVYQDGEALVLVDPAGYAVAWSGPDVLASPDTSSMHRQQAEAFVRALEDDGGVPQVFHVSTDSLNHLIRSGADYVVSRAGRVIAWGGPTLPGFADGAPPSAEAQALYGRIAAGTEPFTFRVRNEQLIHYGDRQLWISVAPFVTVGVLLLFVLIGWVGSRNIRHSEQRSIWVGMAKETAHQLGTPLSSLSGWLELMGGRVRDLVTVEEASRDVAADAVDDVVREMQQDLGRLNQIASRFSQIGSVPELKPADVRDVVA